MQSREYSRNLNAVSIERLFSLISGGALLSYGLVRRKPLTLPLAIVGGGLVYHAVRGNRVDDLEDWGVKGVPTSRSVPYGHGIRVVKSVTIARSPDDLYRYWHNLENLPIFMSHLKSVTVLDGTHSHWVARAPGPTQVEWDAEIVNDIPNQVIGWRSSPNSDVPNAGSVQFSPATNGRGTMVKVELEYSPPGGPLGAAFAKMFGREPSQTIGQDLRHLKQLMEAGEVATVEGQSHGSRNPLSKFMRRPARESKSIEEIPASVGMRSTL